MSETRKLVGLRIPLTNLAQIDQLAATHRMSRTEYMIRAALGDLQPEIDRLQAIEERLGKLENA